MLISVHWPDRASKNALVVALALLVGNVGALGDPARAVVSAASSSQRSAPTAPAKPNVVNAFQSSEFCRTYKCTASDSWALKSGGMNHTYKISATPDVGVELQTDADKLIGGGLVFYEREHLSKQDLALAKSFVVSLSPEKRDFDPVMRTVQTNIERKVFQVDRSPLINLGQMRIHAGKVGNEQTLSIRLSAPQSGRGSALPLSTAARSPTISASKCNRVRIGTSWDDALSTLNAGKRVDLIRESSDRFTDVRDFGGTTCRYTFERPASPGLGPYRVVAIR